MDIFWFVTRTVRAEITVSITWVSFVAVLLVFGDSAGLLRVVTSAWQSFDVFSVSLRLPIVAVRNSICKKSLILFAMKIIVLHFYYFVFIPLLHTVL
jgi:hypothetical protein